MGTITNELLHATLRAIANARGMTIREIADHLGCSEQAAMRQCAGWRRSRQMRDGRETIVYHKPEVAHAQHKDKGNAPARDAGHV